MKKLFFVLLVAAAIVALVKLSETKRYFMEGSEDELRDRVRTKFADKVPEEKLSQVEDKVVERARRKGTLRETA